MTKNDDMKFVSTEENSKLNTPGWKNLEEAIHKIIRTSLFEQDYENYLKLRDSYE